MKKLALLFLIPIGLTACQKNIPVKSKQLELTKTEEQIAVASNAFGFEFFRHLQDGEENINQFVSPLSIHMALGMTLNGAAGNTHAQMLEAMYLTPFTTEEINQTFSNLILNLPGLDPGVKFTIANSIWHHQDYPVNPEFLSVNHQNFQSKISPLDFNSPASRDIINKWVEDETNGLINKIIEEIKPDNVMFLINALYFKADWTHEFDKKNTYLSDFHKIDNATVKVDMMTQNNQFGVYGDEQIQVLDMPYGDSVFSMSIILPHSHISLQDVIAGLNEDKFRSYTQNLNPVKLDVRIPKFKFEYEKNLNDALQNMGMTDAFIENLADLSKISSTGGRNLFIDEVLHKTYVDVMEEGTEAAAVTSVGISVTSAPPSFTANRPFLFIIRENKYNTIIFMGKITEPVY